MTEADARLKALFREDRPLPRDPWFRIAVMERMARRRMRQRLSALAVAGAAATVALVEAAPRLSPALAAQLLIGLGLAVAGIASLWALRQLRRPI